VKDVSEHMVPNAMVQFAGHSRRQSVFMGQLHGRLYLMNRLGVFYSASVDLRRDENRLFYLVGQSEALTKKQVRHAR